jgi:hypothetical protein
MTENIFVIPRLIKEWMQAFANLYSQSDKGRTAEEFWIATMAHSSGIGETIRKFDFPELMKAAAHTFCWMCCYVDYCNKTDDLLFHCKHSLCDIVFFKYPAVCGLCQESPCKCDAFKTDSKKDKAADYKNLLQKWKGLRRKEGRTIEEWLNIFKPIYGGRIHLLTLESIGFHFLEEAGEEAKAVRQLVQMRSILNSGVAGLDKKCLQDISEIEKLVEEYDKCEKDEEGRPVIRMKSKALKDVKARIVKAKMDFLIELADTFSWLCSILIKVLRITEINKVSNSEIYDLQIFLEKEYQASESGLRCPTCHESPCQCVFFPASLNSRSK